MKQLALISALLLAAAPAAAQLATSSRVQQLGGEPVQSTPTVVPTIGVFCIEEMTATFCNVVTGPNVPGHGFKLQAAIAGEYIAQMVARLECGVLAVPVHSARPDINYRAQGALPTSSARSSPQACYCRNDGDSSRQSCELRPDHRDYL